MMSEPFDPRYDVATAQSQGSRERQEDAVAVSCPQGAEFGFAVVSDGMGGHAAGDLASRIIVAEIFAELTLRGRASMTAPDELAELLKDSVETANASLQAQIEAYPDQLGMGGTVVATSLVDGGMQWVSVGDSLLYLVRDGMLKRLNDDHSMGPQIDLMAKNGMIDAETARTHPQRNYLTSALTGKDIPELDCPERRLSLEDGDIIVLASDGLQALAEEDLASILDASSHLRGARNRDGADRRGRRRGRARAGQYLRRCHPGLPARAEAAEKRRSLPRGRSVPPVVLAGPWRPHRASAASLHRHSEAGRLTHDGHGSRYPVHA
jgi:serine/threonine protein phosphatase PrpC